MVFDATEGVAELLASRPITAYIGFDPSSSSLHVGPLLTVMGLARLQLFDRYGCVLQMGGSDQWGNITAGTDLIRKLRSAKAHGLVWPLMKTASGVKFGKTEAGTVWLDATRTSPFTFY